MKLQILLVEDEEDKRQKVLGVIAGLEMGEDAPTVSVANNVVAARRAISQQRFDLVILDIALPRRQDSGIADPNAGIELLEDIIERRPEQYKTPTHIVGLTGYSEIYDATAGRFAGWAMSVIRYDAGSTGWIEALRARVRNIADGLNALTAEGREYRTDLGIVAALMDPELESVRQLDWKWSQRTVAGDHTIYWTGQFASKQGERTVCAAAAPRMGLAATAVLASKLIAAFRPRTLVMVGITAGVRGKVNMGDIIAADPSWDWGSGKWSLDGSTTVFSPAPFQIPLDGEIRENIRALSLDTELFSRIRREWPGEKPDHVLTLRLGPVASGASVLADGVTISTILSQHRQLLGLEMEAYGLMAAAQECSAPRPRAMALKSVVDFADATKDDRFRNYAAYASARTLKHFAERYL